MPKKLVTNSKAIEARVRKETKKKAEQERIEKEKEDALWKEDDKLVLRKLERKEEKEKKKQEIADKKATLKAVYEEEMSSIKTQRSQLNASTNKVTRAQIATLNENKEKPIEKQAKIITHLDTPLEENVNQVEVEGDEARTIEEAINILSVKETELDRHPEKRLKAAYTEFEEKRLPELKAENPNLRLSQLKQLLKKEWLKSPENPLNQKHIAYNAAR